MVVIAIVAIVVVGPKELPGMLRAIGKSIGKIKRMAGDFQRQVDDAVREADLDDIKDIASNKTFAPLEDAKKSMEDFAKTVQNPLDAHKAVINDELESPAVEEVKKTTKAAPKKATPKKPTANKPAPKKGASKATVTKPASTKKAPSKSAAAKKTATSKSAS